MRTAFITELIEVARRDERVVLIVGDLGFSVVEAFQNEFPTRFFNAGISEQSMMGLAAGLASEGFRPFVYSIANFPTFRCAEQIRNDVAYHGLPVTIVSVGGGLVYGNMGYSHHAVQDYALMRVMPGMTILAPGDSAETRACVNLALALDGPSYIRLGNPATPDFHTTKPELVPGEWLFAAGNPEANSVILTTGGCLTLALEWLEDGRFADAAVYCLPVWGMDYKHQQPTWVSKFDSVTTVEDHLVDAGFGSWLVESLLVNQPELCARVSIKGLDPSVTKHVAKEDVLRSLGGLSLS